MASEWILVLKSGFQRAFSDCVDPDPELYCGSGSRSRKYLAKDFGNCLLSRLLLLRRKKFGIGAVIRIPNTGLDPDPQGH
jgi:hypothetical protein